MTTQTDWNDVEYTYGMTRHFVTIITSPRWSCRVGKLTSMDRFRKYHCTNIRLVCTQLNVFILLIFFLDMAMKILVLICKKKKVWRVDLSCAVDTRVYCLFYFYFTTVIIWQICWQGEERWILNGSLSCLLWFTCVDVNIVMACDWLKGNQGANFTFWQNDHVNGSLFMPVCMTTF